MAKLTSYEAAVRPSVAGDHTFRGAEIDDFERSLGRFLAGQTPEAVFLEYRLRHGVYGQRQDGVHMMRSKIPLGVISPEQLEAFADVAENFGHGVAHLTTRQDIQTHFVELPQTPDFMRVLNDAAATSREACGNVVRNVVASPLAGVEVDEAFDVTAYGMALTTYLLRHPDGQSLGRKFKVSLAGSFDPAWNLAPIHDLGITAVVDEDGNRGFHVVVGGGLGAVPHEAQVLSEFLPVDELLPTSLAVLRLFARLGEKKNRARARLKFVVAKLGIEEFRRLVAEERAGLPHEQRWSDFDFASFEETPLYAGGEALPSPRDDDEAEWFATNLFPQKQPGYSVVRVRIPRGDLTPDQLRGLADLLRSETGDTLRVGWDQSVLIRWVSWDRVRAVRGRLVELGLGSARSGGIADPVTCPGADTCKLGITSPRSVARQVEQTLNGLSEDPRLNKIRIHISGCPNSCAQHQIADIGFFGAARTVKGATAPHFMVLLGGLAGGWGGPGLPLGSGFGIPVTKIPAARLGEAVEVLGRAYLQTSQPDEVFGYWAKRQGRSYLKDLLTPLMELPSFDEAPELYREFGQSESFAVRRGKGECEGEVVLLADLLLADADREAELAGDLFEQDADPVEIHARAVKAMDFAAQALLSTDGLTNPTNYELVPAFKSHWYDRARIFEGVGHYYLEASEEDPSAIDSDRLRRAVVEAGLFVEEAHTIIGRLQNPLVGAAK